MGTYKEIASYFFMGSAKNGGVQTIEKIYEHIKILESRETDRLRE